MYPQQVHGYLQSLFQETGCPVLTEHPHYLTVQLTVDMDKRVMNRPYYWQYIESSGGEPAPAQLTLIADKTSLQEEIRGEIIHFGSPRLNLLFKATRELGSFVQMYEISERETNTILTPWLGVNYKVSYYCDQTKEMLHSLGVNLITGAVVEDFQEKLRGLRLDSEPTGNIFNLPYVIKPSRAIERLEEFVEQMVLRDNHEWAEEAKERWQRDLEVLEYFYVDVTEKPECYELEKKAMEEQYSPRIKMEIINGGLFHLI